MRTDPENDALQTLDFPTRFAIMCSGGSTLELIAGIQKYFEELVPALRSRVFAVRLDLSRILNKILASDTVMDKDQEVLSELQDLYLRFQTEDLEIEQLRNPVDIYDILVRNRCDSYLQQILEGEIQGIIPLFSLILEGIIGGHPQSEAIKKWFSTMGYSRFADNGKYPYDVAIPPIDFSCKSYPPEILNAVQYLESKCNQIFMRNGSDYYFDIRIEFARIISDIYDSIDPKMTIPRTFGYRNVQTYIHSKYYFDALMTRERPH